MRQIRRQAMMRLVRKLHGRKLDRSAQTANRAHHSLQKGTTDHGVGKR